MKRAIVTLSLLVAAFAPLAPRASAEGAVLTLDGTRTASVDVTLRLKTTFDYLHATFTSKSRFVGFYAEAIDKPVANRDQNGARLGAVTIRDYHPPGDSGHTLDLASSVQRSLDPGRYRIYLIADGPASVRLPITGSTNFVLRPKRPASASAAVNANILVNPLEATNRQPLTVTGSRSISFSSILVGQFRAYLGTIGACLAKPQKDCGSATSSGADAVYTGFVVSPLYGTYFAFTVTYLPGVLPPGAYNALQDAINATTLQFAAGAAFTLNLS